MKTSEKVLFIIGAFFALAATLIAVFAAYFGIAALVNVHIHGVVGIESIGVAFLVVFMIIFSAVAIGAALVAATLLLIRPARSEMLRVRRISRVLLLLVLSAAALLIGLFVACMVSI